MSKLVLTLPEAVAKRLAGLAAREGQTPEHVAVAAVQAMLDDQAAARREIEAGLAELDSGQSMSLENYEREMDAFMASIQAGRA